MLIRVELFRFCSGEGKTSLFFVTFDLGVRIMRNFNQIIMLVSFELKMANIGSWNGRWSGEGSRYVKVINLSKSQIESILGEKESDSFHHRWDDGWSLNIYVTIIDSKKKRELSKHFKNGFCGYEWMISNIINHQSTYNKKSLHVE